MGYTRDPESYSVGGRVLRRPVLWSVCPLQNTAHGISFLASARPNEGCMTKKNVSLYRGQDKKLLQGKIQVPSTASVGRVAPRRAAQQVRCLVTQACILCSTIRDNC